MSNNDSCMQKETFWHTDTTAKVVTYILSLRPPSLIVAIIIIFNLSRPIGKRIYIKSTSA